MSQFTKKYDLEERTAKFGGEIIRFCKSIQETTISRPIISQLIRSVTSIGTNYSQRKTKCRICHPELDEG